MRVPHLSPLARRGLLLAMLAPGLAGAQTQPTVAAASDLKFALEQIAAQYQRDTGQALRLVFGSSGTFFTQIRQGAPFHLYMAADEDFVFKLADAGLTVDRGRLYARGRIGLFVPQGSRLRADPSLRDLDAALRDGRLRKLAIANPEHAPYGMRAREALRHAGLWDRLQPHLVLGENISQATQFAVSGHADAGLIALSLAIAPGIAAKGEFAPLPEAWHQPLNQRMVLLKHAPPATRAFYDYLGRPSARAIFARYGFDLPAD